MPDSYVPAGIDYDIALGASGYFLASSPETPHRRQTVPFRKEQVDQGREVGEQSLSGWWMRSQSSFHGGAGQRFLDGGETSEVQSNRFYQSRSVDVWTPGEVTPLPPLGDYTLDDTSSGMLVAAVDGFYFLNDMNENLYFHNIYTNLAELVNDIGNGSPAKSLTSDGTFYYIARDSGIYRGRLDSHTTASTKLYNTGNVMLRYVKARLMAASGRFLYELDPLASAVALPTPFYTHPSEGFTWNNFTEVPQGIYASGFTFTGGNVSSIHLIELDTSGATPVLAAPVQVVEMPHGEQIKDRGLYGYVGRYLVMVTTAGIRVSTIDSSGHIEIGPVMLDGRTLRGPTYDSIHCGGIASRDGYIFISTNGSAHAHADEMCLLRIDVGMELAPGHYAWASDQISGGWTSIPRSLLFDEEGKAVVCTTDGIFRTYAGPWHDGWLMTSAIRYGTAEDKIFQAVKTTGYDSSGAGGAIYTWVLRSNGDYNPFGSVFVPQGSPSATLTIEDTWAGKTGEFVHVEFDFELGLDTSDPRLTGYQVRALPSPTRFRVEQIPLLCFDYEKDRTGQMVGYDGRAWERLRALEALEEEGKTIFMERLGPNFNPAGASYTDTETVVIESVEFVQTVAPPPRCSGFGGLLLVTVRKVDG